MEQFTFSKKYFLLLFVLFLTPFLGFSQHFTQATNNGAGNWHIYTTLADLDGVALEAGDEIALFHGNVCVGARTLTAELDGSYGLAVANDFIAYETNNGDPGYTGGNTYSWRCWDASASAEYIGSMTYNLTHSPQDYVGGTFPATMTFRWSWVDLAFTAVAPTAGDIDGTITNSDGGAPIEGVSVTATGASTYTTSTDVNGDYLFDGIDIGVYNVTTSHADFQDAGPIGVTVTDGVTTTQNFTLTYKTGILNGFVYDQFSAPVVGATVLLTGGATDDTDGTGAYSISGLAPGTFTGTASEPGYSNTVIAGLVISPNATTTQNFTINAAGTLSGTVTDGTNTGTEDGVLVTVVETGDFVTTAGGGLFSFDLSTGTYSLTFAKATFSSASLSGLSVTAGNTTTADVTIFAPVWGDFEDGDPFSDVWTVYLNTVTGDGTPLKAGDELSVWAPDERGNNTAYAPFESGTIASVAGTLGGAGIGSTASSFASPSGESGEITSVTNQGGQAGFRTSNTPLTASVVDIINTSTYNTTNETVGFVDLNLYFQTSLGFGVDDAGYWVLNSSSTTTVTAANIAVLGLVDGHTVTISGGSIYDGSYVCSNVTATTFDLPIKWLGPATATWSIPAAIITTSSAHGLTDADNIVISGASPYNGTWSIYNASGSVFTIPIGYTTDPGAGNWAHNTATQVTSTAHGRSNGESVTISGSTNYNGPWTVANATANTYEIATAFVGDDAAGGWVYGEQIVGAYLFDGPVSGAGTTHALKAYSVLNDASTGYESGEFFTFKLSYAGGAILTTLNSTTFAATGGGLTHPGTTFPGGNAFSKVDLDFDLPPGDLDVKFTDELAAAPDANLTVELFKSGVSVATLTYASGSGAYLNFPSLDAGDYSITVTSERFETTSYTGISIAPSTTTTKDYTINHFADETQTIALTSGYQLVSRRVGDDSFDMSDFIATAAPIATTEIDLIKDEDGTSDTYLAGVVTDGGVNWDIKRGYNFKMNTASSIEITGTPIKYSADIAIRTGFNMISYLPDYILDGEVAFADLMTNDLEFIRDRDGNSITKVNGSWVDHIGNSSAGEGFLVKWTGAPVTFNYPASAKSANVTDNTAELVHFPFYNGYGNPMKDTYTMYIGGADLEIGDEVAAYDGTTLVGATVITSDNNLDNNLNAFEELFDGAGFSAGNQITLKLWKASEDKEYWLNITNTSETDNMYKETVYPSTDGMKSTMDVTLSPLGLNDNLAEFISVYPNPSNGLVNISSPENIERITVINLVGQTVLDITPSSSKTQLNLEGYQSGLYFVNMVIEGQRITKKLTIQ